MPDNDSDWVDVPDTGERWQGPRLRVLVDAHVPHELVEEFRHGGNIDVRTAQEMGVANLDDPDLFQFAKRSGRVLLTMDEGFWLERRYPCQRGGGIVFLNVGPQDTDRALEAFVFAYVSLLKVFGNTLLDGFRVKAIADQLTLKFRSHEGRLTEVEARLHHGKIQVKEQAGGDKTK